MARVAVIGAGMAGLACVRVLQRQDLRPRLIAPVPDVVGRGETLSFRARPYLEALDWLPLFDEVTALACEGRYSVWGSAALRRDDTHTADAGGWHIDRRELEARMAATLESERIVATVQNLARTSDGVSITLSNGARLEADIVIDCSGRASVSAGDARLTRLDRLVACYAIVTLDEADEVAAATLVEAVADGWWYMTALPARRVMVGYFTDSDLLPPGLSKNATVWAAMASGTLAVSRRLDSLGIDLGRAIPRFAAASTVTATAIVERRILRAGDAASALDPLAANGLATALWSGMQAAGAVPGLLAGDAAASELYEQSFLAGIAAHLSGQRALYASERRFRGSAFWQRRNGSGGGVM